MGELRLGGVAGFVAEGGGHELAAEEFAVGASGGAADEKHVREGDDEGGESEECAPGPVDEEARALKLRGEDGRAEDDQERAGGEQDRADDAEGDLPAGEGQLVGIRCRHFIQNVTSISARASLLRRSSRFGYEGWTERVPP